MDFSLKIVKEALISNGEEENLILSPVSIAALLGILAFGPLCSKSTLKLVGAETPDDLRLNYSILSASSSNFSDTSPGEEGDPVVSFVNGAWADQSVGFEPFFEQTLQSLFNAEAKLLHFQKQGAKEINSWVENSTMGLIKKILDEESSMVGIDMIFANALYFKGQWKDRFELHESDRFFYTGKGEQFVAPFMRSDSDYEYRSLKNFRVAKIPYKSGHRGRQFSMNLFLPNATDGLPALLEEFSANPSLFLRETLSTLHSQKFEEFMIPNFKFSYGRGLTKIMTKLGLNMSGVEVFQKARIIVDEEGTEAAAVTHAFTYCEDNGSPPKLPRFVADHPFMFVIREDDTIRSRMPFFVGVVVNPLAEN